MKKSITGVIAIVLLTLSTAFANTNNRNEKKEAVKQRVEKSFKKEFAGAQQATWSKVGAYHKVQFSYNGQVMFAVLNDDGKTMGVYRNILSHQLPINLMTSLKEDYSGYWITELFELVQDNETFYYVHLESADKSITLRSENGSQWSEYQMSNK
ncbi:hypothetical protein [Flavihumibacter petaseus]|uniref:Beta-lactamase-inhibitor-like PepSY-like domain-containing protein n=1 Tax=Flavihumibacter petaseus NBRC 106054 TaxID=1220578 RepID=A0A0E9MXH1_9BACT|nr:hypothetical protein [Flavihumibacter petaseus]GAO42397.1 hypothetical protein FPE01S_01_14120 [Flavihumibacter petaseus NBRC 106054]